jgi:hypothetical protein
MVSPVTQATACVCEGTMPYTAATATVQPHQVHACQLCTAFNTAHPQECHGTSEGLGITEHMCFFEPAPRILPHQLLGTALTLTPHNNHGLEAAKPQQPHTQTPPTCSCSCWLVMLCAPRNALLVTGFRVQRSGRSDASGSRALWLLLLLVLLLLPSMMPMASVAAAGHFGSLGR